MPLSVGTRRGNIQVRLLGRFDLLVEGTAVAVPAGLQRVIAGVALQPRPVLRLWLAGTLWPEATDHPRDRQPPDRALARPSVSAQSCRSGGAAGWPPPPRRRRRARSGRDLASHRGRRRDRPRPATARADARPTPTRLVRGLGGAGPRALRPAPLPRPRAAGPQPPRRRASVLCRGGGPNGGGGRPVAGGGDRMPCGRPDRPRQHGWRPSPSQAFHPAARRGVRRRTIGRSPRSAR